MRTEIQRGRDVGPRGPIMGKHRNGNTHDGRGISVTRSVSHNRPENGGSKIYVYLKKAEGGGNAGNFDTYGCAAAASYLWRRIYLTNRD